MTRPVRSRSRRRGSGGGGGALGMEFVATLCIAMAGSIEAAWQVFPDSTPGSLDLFAPLTGVSWADGGIQPATNVSVSGGQFLDFGSDPSAWKIEPFTASGVDTMRLKFDKPPPSGGGVRVSLAMTSARYTALKGQVAVTYMDMQNLEFKALCGTSFDQSAGRLSVDISSDILNSPGFDPNPLACDPSWSKFCDLQGGRLYVQQTSSCAEQCTLTLTQALREKATTIVSSTVQPSASVTFAEQTFTAMVSVQTTPYTLNPKPLVQVSVQTMPYASIMGSQPPAVLDVISDVMRVYYNSVPERPIDITLPLYPSACPGGVDSCKDLMYTAKIAYYNVSSNSWTVQCPSQYASGLGGANGGVSMSLPVPVASSTDFCPASAGGGWDSCRDSGLVVAVNFTGCQRVCGQCRNTVTTPQSAGSGSVSARVDATGVNVNLIDAPSGETATVWTVRYSTCSGYEAAPAHMYSQVVRLAAAPGVVGSSRRVSLVVPVSSDVPDGGYVNLAWYNATSCSWVRLCTSKYDAASFSATVELGNSVLDDGGFSRVHPSSSTPCYCDGTGGLVAAFRYSQSCFATPAPTTTPVPAPLPFGFGSPVGADKPPPSVISVGSMTIAPEGDVAADVSQETTPPPTTPPPPPPPPLNTPVPLASTPVTNTPVKPDATTTPLPGGAGGLSGGEIAACVLVPIIALALAYALYRRRCASGSSGSAGYSMRNQAGGAGIEAVKPDQRLVYNPAPLAQANHNGPQQQQQQQYGDRELSVPPETGLGGGREISIPPLDGMTGAGLSGAGGAAGMSPYMSPYASMFSNSNQRAVEASRVLIYTGPEGSPAPPGRELPPTPGMRQPSPRGPPSLLADDINSRAARVAASRFRPPSPGASAKPFNVGSNLLMDPDEASLGKKLPDHLSEAMDALSSVAADYGWSRADAPSSSSAPSNAVEGSIGLGAVSYPRQAAGAASYAGSRRDGGKGTDPVAAALAGVGGGMGVLSHPPAPKGSARARAFA